MSFQAALGDAAKVSEACIADALKGCESTIAAPMIYATRGGKALRAFLVLEGARLHGIGPNEAKNAAAAIECLHAYSLVHDDLPCMDDDDLRRGNPTVHVKWDEATAVLTGDALQTFAFELIAQTECSLQARLDLSLSLARASGIKGMVGGQAADISAETAQIPLTLGQIIALQKGKTGALIEWSAMAGAIMSEASTDALQTYGDRLGLAFQIADDVLDVTGDAATVGKAVGKDQSAGKATFVSLLGLEGARARASNLVDEACDALVGFGDDADTLKQAARFVITRGH
jgi:farnesyl diphosphate synthase